MFNLDALRLIPAVPPLWRAGDRRDRVFRLRAAAPLELFPSS